MKYSIHNEEKVKEMLVNNNLKVFRYDQIENAIYKNFIWDFLEISTISKDLRELLYNNFYYESINAKEIINSDNWQTTKILFETFDNKFIESVIMRHRTWRITLCISCQVWCPMKCSFCATWKLWLTRNLTYEEIVEQVYYSAKLLNNEWNILRNVVYMWMWEPFLNYENVEKSIKIITNQKKLNLANRRITVSTCWIIPWIEKFLLDFPQTSLAISLHAPNDFIRDKIMPVNKKFPLKELIKCIYRYIKTTNKKVFFEYIMIKWINDDISLASELWELLKWKLAHVNFIPYNPWVWTWWEKYLSSSRKIIENFQRILEKYWVVSTIRHTMWDDIDAACWQLANKKIKLENN